MPLALLRSSGLLAIRCLLLGGLLLSAIPMPAEAQFIPPDRGMPGRREGGGTRGCWGVDPATMNRSSLTALAPAQNFGYTLDAYPSFFVYIPPSFADTAVAATFTLQDAEDNLIYEANYQVSNRSGIIRIDLPHQANLQPLTVGQDYNWSFTLVCNQEDPSANLVVDSWIQRIEPTTQLQTDLDAADAGGDVEVLASQGIWYNTLTQLAAVEDGGDRQTVLSQWQTLLNSVNLTTLAEELNVDALTFLSPAPSPEVSGN